MAFIQPMLKFPCESFMVFLFFCGCPWLGMMGFPNGQFPPPWTEFGLRHGIGEPEGNELHDLALLPVGKIGPVFEGLVFGMVELGHEGRLCLK